MKTQNGIHIPEIPSSANNVTLLLTFLDLMTLLLAFFIVLHALSEIDRHKFSSFGQSLQIAFASELLPMEYPSQKTFKVDSSLSNASQTLLATQKELYPLPTKSKSEPYAHTEKDTQILQHLMRPEIKQGWLTIVRQNAHILIEVSTKKTYATTSAELKAEARPVLEKLSAYLNGLPGKIIISGHSGSDSQHLSRYRSDWELAAARAYTLIDFMVEHAKLEKARFHLEAYSGILDTDKNYTPTTLAQTQRIKILIDQSSFYDT